MYKKKQMIEIEKDGLAIIVNKRQKWRNDAENVCREAALLKIIILKLGFF